MTLFLIIIQILLPTTNPDSWVSDWENAKSIALSEEKSILMVFAGSDWCAPCIKLKKNILITDVFQEYENDNLVVLYLDFPAKKKNKLSKEQTKHNESLADQFNRSGRFPHVLLLDSKGKPIKTINYDGQSPESFIGEIEESL